MSVPKLLIIEDDMGLCSQYRWAFPSCQVLFAHTRAQALQVAQKEHPSVAIMDLGLPPDPDGVSEGFATLPGWSVGIVLTIPGFPEETLDADPAADPPVFYHQPPDDPAHYHLSDVRLDGGQVFARRRTGYAMVVTGTGATVPAAQAAAMARARNVVIPNLRWRTDIGDRFLAGEGARLQSLGWLPRLGRAA